jgi:phosphatidylserine decarboxylase
MTIHREGRTLLIALIVILSAFVFAIGKLTESDTAVNVAIILSVIFYLIVLQFFRSPSRSIEINPNNIIAPADGKVVVIEETTETEYLKDKRIQVSIFMSPVNVHINRMPVGGTISFCKYHPGKYLVAWHPKSSTENERTTIAVKMTSGTEILFRQIAGALARRICWYVKEGQQLQQGEEFGFIKFGSRVDIFLPMSAKIAVNLDQKTVGGKTVIATLA